MVSKILLCCYAQPKYDYGCYVVISLCNLGISSFRHNKTFRIGKEIQLGTIRTDPRRNILFMSSKDDLLFWVLILRLYVQLETTISTIQESHELENPCTY